MPETLVRVAGAERKLTPEAMQANAIVTARHLVLDHANSTSMERRHQHRLVDFTTLDGLEQLTLEREETDALAAALEMLDPEDRALRVRHESDGVSTEVLASDAGVSRGVVVMRLARARATLRLEFVLAVPPVAGRERQQDQTAPSRGNVTRRSHNAAQISCRFDPHALEADVVQSRCGTVRRRRTWLLSLCSPHQLRTQPPPTSRSHRRGGCSGGAVTTSPVRGSFAECVC
jgi:hypothetical protein